MLCSPLEILPGEFFGNGQFGLQSFQQLRIFLWVVPDGTSGDLFPFSWDGTNPTHSAEGM